MRTQNNQNTICLLILLLSLACFSSCISSQKMDAHVAQYYGNRLPKPNKMKANIEVSSAYPSNNAISSTVKKTTNILPLVIIWKYDYRHTCTLNPAIAVSGFSNGINSMSAKLAQKLNGRKLELTVEQVPNAFAIVDREMIVLFVHWDRIYVEPDTKDMVISYKVLENDAAVKTGKIRVKSPEHNRDVRFAQSWRSSATEYLSGYQANITSMSKSFVTKLLEEL